MSTTFEESTKIQEKFEEEIIQQESDLKFACIINKNGRISREFNEGFLDINNKKKEILFMETALQTNMSKDFDKDLGNVQCNVTERNDGLKYVSAPLSSKKTVFAIMKKTKDHVQFVKNVSKINEMLKQPAKSQRP